MSGDGLILNLHFYSNTHQLLHEWGIWILLSINRLDHLRRLLLLLPRRVQRLLRCQLNIPGHNFFPPIGNNIASPGNNLLINFFIFTVTALVSFLFDFYRFFLFSFWGSFAANYGLLHQSASTAAFPYLLLLLSLFFPILQQGLNNRGYHLLRRPIKPSIALLNHKLLLPLSAVFFLNNSAILIFWLLVLLRSCISTEASCCASCCDHGCCLGLGRGFIGTGGRDLSVWGWRRIK